MATTNHPEESNLVYLFGLLGGGLALGFGIISLYYSFGYPGADMNGDFKAIGFSAIDNIQLLDAADYSFGFIVLGAMVMVMLNATAWKRTGGY